MKKNVVLLGIAFLVLVTGVVAQQTLPTLIALQGKLTNTTTGATIVNADLRVNISDISGITVWNETFASGVSNGFFDLLLGSSAGNPLNLTFNEDYNISIYVGDSATQIGGTYRFRSGVGGISPSNISAGNFSAAGNFSFGSSLFVDKTNNRVGIGTTSPSSNLEVFGSSRFNNTLFVNGSRVGIMTSSPATLLELQHDDNGGAFRVLDSAGDLRVRIDSNYHFFLTQSGGGDVVKIADDDASYFTGGSLGIGTNAPTKALSVNGTTSLNALTIDPDALTPTINTTGQNLTISSNSGSVIIQLG